MKVHFLGIGGSGASAAAALAQAQGFEVTGCDQEPNNEFTTQFEIYQLFKGHSPDHLYCHPERSEGSLDSFQNPLKARLASGGKSGDSSLIAQNDKIIDILTVTPAIFSLDPDNPELLEAKKLNIPTLTWQQFLGEYLTQDKFVIAVCGTHGKTTTTAMIAKLLEDAGLDPTVELGAIVPWWKTNFRVGKGEYFVVEADEFNDNFLSLKPDISVITNVEMDHPEYFKDFESYKKSFDKFIKQSKKVIDKPNSKLINFPLIVPGFFNILNASLAYQLGLALGIDPQTIKKSLSTYSGIGRRFEYLGTFHGAKVYSDFGHHPTEIKVTMQAAREKFPTSRIILIYQPHMFTRTKALFDDFVKVFKDLPVDKAVILDIYPSREIDAGLVTSKQLVEAINKENITYFTWKDLKTGLGHDTTSEDILFFMGAGDIDKLARKLVSKNT